jgi:hypothetical protein
MEIAKYGLCIKYLMAYIICCGNSEKLAEMILLLIYNFKFMYCGNLLQTKFGELIIVISTTGPIPTICELFWSTNNLTRFKSSL